MDQARQALNSLLMHRVIVELLCSSCLEVEGFALRVASANFGFPPVVVGALLVEFFMRSELLVGRSAELEKAPVLDLRAVHEEGPCLMVIRQYDAVKVISAETVDGAGAKHAFRYLIRLEPLFQVTTREYHAAGLFPGVVM